MTTLLQTALQSFSSIRTRITLGGVVALALGIAATTFVLVRQAEQNTLSSQRERELQDAAQSAGMLSRRAVDLQRALVATANTLTPAVLADRARLTTFIADKPVLRGLFSGVFLANRQGDVLLLTQADLVQYPSVNIADRAYFQQMLSENRPVISDAIQSRVSIQPIITFASPLVSGGEVYGLLGGTIRLSSRDLLAEAVQQGEAESGLLQIVTDASGRILSHPDRSRIMESLATEPRMAMGFERWVAAGASVEPAGLLMEQAGEVLAVAGVPGPNWVLWRALPESELLAPLRAARREALSWAAGIVVVASLGVFGLISVLLRPLLLLQRRALHLFDADHDIDTGWPRSRGEIGEIVRVLRQVGSERSQLEQINADVLARLGLVMAAAPVGIMFTRGMRFELVSAEFCRIVGRPESTLLGQTAEILFGQSDDAARLAEAATAAFDKHALYLGEWQMQKADGSVFWARLRGQLVDHTQPDAGTIWTLTDSTEQVALRQQLEWSAGHDPLTGLANRKVFERRAGEAFDARPKSIPAAVIMIDLDRFKPINDSAGHAAGDAMLKAVAETITEHTRATDLAARLGGDEFAVLLERCPPEAAERIAHDLRRAIAKLVLPWEGRELSVGASLGLAPLTMNTDSVASWVQAADRACYEAKAAGRNAVRIAGAADTLLTPA